MKRFIIVATIMIVALSLFLLSGCDPGPGPGPDPDTKYYTLSISISPGTNYGSVNVYVNSDDLNDENKIKEGAEVTLEPVPGIGVYFAQWTGADGGDVNDNKLIMDSDKNITAEFTTNQPPHKPYYPTPSFEQTHVATRGVVLKWTGGDPDGDAVTYDIYIAPNAVPSTVTYADVAVEEKALVTELQANTTYHWKVVASDGTLTKESNEWTFTTGVANTAPTEPNTPYPEDGKTDVTTGTLTLTWLGGDPDAGDTVTYDFYLGIDGEEPSLNQSDLASPTCDLNITLAYTGSTFDWYVVAKDQHSSTTEGPEWTFVVGYPLTITVTPTQAETDGCVVDTLVDGVPDSGPYPNDTVVTLVPNPATDYVFSRFYDGDSTRIEENEGVYTITMDEAAAFKAEFLKAVPNGDTFSEPFEGPDTDWANLTSGYDWTLASKLSDKEPILQGVTVHGGTQAVQFYLSYDTEWSSFEIAIADVSANKALSFWYYRDTDTSHHTFTVTINGEDKFVANEDTTGWEEVQIPLSEGVNSLKFHANCGYSSIKDQLFVDDITVIDGAPDINVKYGATDMPSDGSTTDIGDVTIDEEFSFTIESTGTGTLEVSSISLESTGADEITLTNNPTSGGAVDVAAGDTIEFGLTCDTLGSFTSKVITIVNDAGADWTFKVTVNTLGSPIFEEGFENSGSIPTDWTQIHETETLDWTFDAGGHNDEPEFAHNGDYNAFLYGGATGPVTKLVTPVIDCSSLVADGTLKFWHAQVVWGSDQDELRVYYKTSEAGAWTLLVEYTGEVANWTEQTVTLTGSTGCATYYIAFEGTMNYGYGVCIDDVKVYE